MAAELRWETLTAEQGAGQFFQSNSEFRNDSSRNLHIRKIRTSQRCNTVTNADLVWNELSKSPTILSQVDNDSTFRFPVNMAFSLVVAGGGGGMSQVQAADSYGRGQLTLEPGESLYVNTDKTTTINHRYTWVIGYEFT